MKKTAKTRIITADLISEYATYLREQEKSVATVQKYAHDLTALLEILGGKELKVKPLKIQKSMFCTSEKELSYEEYVRLVHTAKDGGDERLSLVLQTICSTGIRVSELKFITAEVVRSGKAEINNKGKRRTILLTDKLRHLLQKYLKKEKRTDGVVFIIKS